ncbi:MAG: hypothetical protein ACI9OH_001588 [Oleispira sp.]
MRKLTPLFIIFILLISTQVAAVEIARNKQGLTSPVLDAKEAYRRGNTDLVGIKLSDGMLLPGIKPERQEGIQKQHRVRILNRHGPELNNLDPQADKQDMRELYKLKRYANRYNLTIMKLIKVEKLEHQSRYRY